MDDCLHIAGAKIVGERDRPLYRRDSGVEVTKSQCSIDCDRIAGEVELPGLGILPSARVDRLGKSVGAGKILLENRFIERTRPAGQPQMSSAVSTTRRSLATSSSKVRLLPSTVEEKPHWGDRQS
jgi:hypothetical protein